MTPDEINEALAQRYCDKRVAIQFSGGLDSATLAYQCYLAGAKEVAFICIDPGVDNRVGDPHYDPDRPEDLVRDQDQFVHYATMIRDWATPANFPILRTRAPNLNGMIVKPKYLLAPENEVAENAEKKYGTTFYAGFVMNHMSVALSIAAANGYDYVLTGHMGWNSHYRDESSYFANAISDLFAWAYDSRLAVVPRVQMPWRDLEIEKVDLVRMNADPRFFFPSHLHISCAPGVCEEVNGVRVRFKYDERGLQYHCGRCEHCIQRWEAFKEAGVVDEAAYKFRPE